jgi:hypothetical protein
MMKFPSIALAILSFITSVVLAAPGDPISAATTADGTAIDVTFEGLAIGGTYSDLGWDADWSPDGVKDITVNMTSLGDDDSGSASTSSRTVYGTVAERWPHSANGIAGSHTSGTFVELETVTQTGTGATAVVLWPSSAGARLVVRTVAGSPNNSGTWVGAGGAVFTPSATPTQLGTDTAPDTREFNNGTNTILRFRLTDYIYADDTSVTVDLLAGIYTSAATPTAQSLALAVTNNSVAVYQPPVANWSWPPYQRVTGAFTLRCVAFQRDARDYRPVRGVEFEVTDGTNTETVIVNHATITSGWGDAVPICEYVADFNAADFNDDAVLTANFRAWGWLGDAATDLDSRDGAAAPSPLIGPQPLYCDNDDDQGVYAKVNPTSPSGTPATYTVGAYNFATAEAYATINAAFAAGANVVELVEDTYAWTGASAATGATPAFWDTVRAGPAQAQASVIISSASGATNISDRTKIEGVTLTMSANNSLTGNDALWIDDCLCNSTGTAMIGAGGVVWLTHNTLQDFQGSTTAAVDLSFALWRGNEYVSPWNNLTRGYTIIGNLRNGQWDQNAGMFEMDKVASGSPTPLPVPILAFNLILGYETTGANDLFEVLDQTADGPGVAVVQNMFEKVDDGPEPIANFSTDDIGALDNQIVWHNTFVGARTGYGYNWTENTLQHRRYWSMVANYYDADACKSDIDTGSAGRHGIRVGNWPVRYGLGSSACVHGGNTEVGPAGYDFEWGGIKDIDAGSQVSTWAQFVDRQAFADAGEAPGLGDYHVQATSPLRFQTVRGVLPFDIAGTRRFSGDPTGAYTWENAAPPQKPGKRKSLIR